MKLNLNCWQIIPNDNDGKLAPNRKKWPPFKHVVCSNKYYHKIALVKEIEDPACEFVIQCQSRDIQKLSDKPDFTPEIQVTFQNWTSSGWSESEVELWTRFTHKHLCRPLAESKSAKNWLRCLQSASIDGNSQYCHIKAKYLVLRQTWNYGIPRYQVSISLEGKLDDLNTSLLYGNIGCCHQRPPNGGI